VCTVYDVQYILCGCRVGSGCAQCMMFSLSLGGCRVGGGCAQCMTFSITYVDVEWVADVRSV